MCLRNGSVTAGKNWLVLGPFELEEMYGKKGRELVQEFAESEPGQLAAFNVCNSFYIRSAY